jgi:murein L,D-transpeptidase YcbB/YkuD
MKWLIVAAALAIVCPPAIGQYVEAEVVTETETETPIWGSAIVSSPSIGQDVEAEAVDYLKEYGYIDTAEETNSVIDSTSLSDAVKKFQEFAGLDETGILDSETQELMKTPRCGMDDRVAKCQARQCLEEERADLPHLQISN